MGQGPAPIDPNLITNPQGEPIPQPQEKPALQPRPLPVEKGSPDEFRDREKDGTLRGTRLAATPDKLGHKMPTLTSLRHDLRPPPERRLHQPPTEHYQAMIRHQVFQDNRYRNSSLYQQLQYRAHPLENTAPTPFKRVELSEMFRFRHTLPHAVSILHFEIEHTRASERPLDEMGIPMEDFLRENSAIGKRVSEGGGESLFEAVLKRLMQGENKVKTLGWERKASFLAKSESSWDQFFQNVERMGSVSLKSVRQSSSLIEALFRGLYRALTGNAGATLVADLQFLEGSRLVTEKFARILIQNPELLARLHQLAPGDVMSREWLEKMGSELAYLNLVHQPEELTEESRAQARLEALQRLRSQVNPEAQAKLEQKLFEEKRRRELKEKNERAPLLREGGGRGHEPSQAFWLPLILGAARRPGKFRPWILFLYSLSAVIFGILVYLVIRFMV